MKPLALSLLVLMGASSTTMANNHQQVQQLTSVEVKEVIQDITEELADSGIALTFPNGLPSMRYDTAFLGIDDSNVSTSALTQAEQQNIIAKLQSELAKDGVSIDFGSHFPEVQHLGVDLDEDQAEIQNAAYHKSLVSIAKEMRASSSTAQAAKIYEMRAGNFFVSIDEGTGTKVLSETETKFVMEMLQDELAMQGYQANFNGHLPTVSVDFSKWLHADNTPLTADDKQEMIADLQDWLAEDGIIADFSQHQPSIKRIPQGASDMIDAELSDKEIAQLETSYKAELNKMAEQVLHSSSVDKAVDIIAAFEDGVDAASLDI